MSSKKTVSKKTKTNSQSVKKIKSDIEEYTGYKEKSFRLVFEYSKVKHYPKNPPLLSTILENKVIEEVVKPLIKSEENILKGKSLICFNTPKTIDKLPTEHQLKTKIFLKIDKFLHKQLGDKSSFLTTEILSLVKRNIPTQFPRLIGQEIEKQLLVMKGQLVTKTLLGKLLKEIKKSLSPKITKKVSRQILDSFIWSHGNNNTLVHTWPVEFNQQFKKDFLISNEYISGDPIFNKDHFPPQTIKNFRITCNKLFGRGCVSNENPIHLCYREKDHQCPVIRGLGGQLLEMISKKKGLMRKLKIKEVTNNSNSHSFTSIIEINGKISGDKTFYIEPKEDYILYIKSGYQTMAMMTPSKDFLKNNEFV